MENNTVQPNSKYVKILGYTVKVGTKRHAILVQQKRQFDDLAAHEVGSGAGPYCALCCNASADLAANPDTFDIHDHVQKCRARLEANPVALKGAA